MKNPWEHPDFRIKHPSLCLQEVSNGLSQATDNLLFTIVDKFDGFCDITKKTISYQTLSIKSSYFKNAIPLFSVKVSQEIYPTSIKNILTGDITNINSPEELTSYLIDNIKGKIIKKEVLRLFNNAQLRLKLLNIE